MALQVKGKTALVTGAGSGIGLEFTKLLLANGCNVLVADLALRPEADEAYRPYQSVPGEPKAEPGVIFHHCDVTNWKQLRSAFDMAMSAFGRLDIVVPNAGIFEPVWSNFWRPDEGKDTDAASSFKIVDINISHPIRATQLAIDYFLRQPDKKGAVVLVSSIAAQMGALPVPMYFASTHAISGFTRSLAALEPEMGIRVNAVAPGIVKTPLWSEKQMTWVDKWCTQREVAEAMLDLVQKEEYVGGSVVEISVGGRRMVEELNDPGPGKEGHSLANFGDAVGQTLELITENFGKEKK